MPNRPAITDDYQKLISDLRREMERGIRKVEKLLERQKVLSYWAIGRRINAYLNRRPLPRGAVGGLYRLLSKDLGINERTLQQCEQFFRYFPQLKPDGNLNWSHYRFLLAVPEAERRAAWLRRIRKERITADNLRLTLMPPAAAAGTKEGFLKPPERGKLFTYRILKAEDVENFDVPWFVDIGFAGRVEAPPCAGTLENKYLYTSEKTGDAYRLKTTGAKVGELFTFRGKPRRVIDGDTLLVVVDQGFSVWSEQRLRLKGIDAPERGTLAGARAKKWLEDELADCANIVVKTHKTDQWDRYLVDVFYLPAEADLQRVAAEGIWLNGRMVERGMAKLWEQ